MLQNLFFHKSLGIFNQLQLLQLFKCNAFNYSVGNWFKSIISMRFFDFFSELQTLFSILASGELKFFIDKIVNKTKIEQPLTWLNEH